MKQSVDIDKIQVFNKLAQTESFTKTAKMLNYPKSRVSRYVSSLEAELGVQLVYRTTRQFQLTEAGKELYRHSHELIEKLRGVVDAVGNRFSAEIEGVVRVSAPEDVGVELLAGLCSDFMKTHPQVAIELSLSDQIVDLVKDSVDLAIRIGQLQDSTLLVRNIGSIRFFLVASHDYLRLMKRPLIIETINEHPFLFFKGITFDRQLKLRRKGREILIDPKQVFSSNNFFVLRDLVLRGHGLMLIPDFMAQGFINSSELVQVFKEWTFHQSPIQLVMPPQREVVPRVRLLADYFYENLRHQFH